MIITLFLVSCCLICVINSSSVLDHTTFSTEGSSTSIHTDINNLINTNNINHQQLKKPTTTSASTTTMSNSNNGKHILVTGGAGYIGTHTILCLLDAGYSIIVIDNLINSSSEGLDRIKLLTTIPSDMISSRLAFHHVDLCNLNELEESFQNYHDKNIHFDCCIHFAGLKAVGESVQKPLLYYENNIGGTINLLNMMDKYKCYSIVFSSSATVYGSAVVPITEETPTGHGITNAYGRTKFMIEEILIDFKRSKDLLMNTDGYIPWSVVILRYFNPVGAHQSGRIGEDPNGIPNNLMPFVNQVYCYVAMI